MLLQMPTRFGFLAPALLLAATSGCQPPAGPGPAVHEGPGRVYAASEGFSLRPPDGYVRVQSFNHFLSFLGPNEGSFTVNINVNSRRDDGTPLDQAGPKVRRLMTMLLADYTREQEGVTSVGGRDAYFAFGSFTWKGDACRNYQLFIRGGNGRMYVVTFASRDETFERYRPVFEECGRTIRTD
jgi:hypothetical protein